MFRGATVFASGMTVGMVIGAVVGGVVGIVVGAAAVVVIMEEEKAAEERSRPKTSIYRGMSTDKPIEGEVVEDGSGE